MKRGLITWNKDELPPEAFESRLARAREVMAEHNVPALVVYSDVFRSNQGRYFSNYMPYWNRALLVIPLEDKPVLLCSLSPRVYPWIKSVTILEEIKPSPNLAQRVHELVAERGWKRIGILDQDTLPYDLFLELSDLETVDVPYASIRPGPDHWELAMYARAESLVREGLAAELPQRTGLPDREFIGRLERRYRRAGAEDLAIVIRPEGVAVSLEYRGHWVRVNPNGAAEFL